MAIEPVIDLSAIDLSQVRMDAEAIGAYNPHRGEVVQIDGLVWMDQGLDHAVAWRDVREDEFWVPGHIPGNPLLPGVLMVEAGAQLASLLYYVRSGKTWFAGFTRIDDTTFRGHVTPGQRMYILAKCLKYHEKRFISRVQGVVDGQLVFDSTITGMAFPKMGDPERVDIGAVGTGPSAPR